MNGPFKNIFRSLKYRNYKLYFAGQSISLIGTWVQRLAMPWLVYHISGSIVLLGLVGFCGQLPTFILAPFAGVFTDRWDRYRMLIVTQVLSMIQAFILFFLYYTNTIAIWHLMVLSIILGTINAFDIPTRQSLVVDMVDDKADLSNAIALNSSMVNSARLIGPSVAGVLIAITGEGTCFLINALSYIGVIICIFFMRIKPREHKPQNKHVLKELKEGFNYTFGIKHIRSIILLLAVISLMGMQYTILLPVFSKNIFHGGAHTFGFLMGASGFGALIGTFYLASRKNISGLYKLVPMAALGFGLSLIGFSLSSYLWLSLLLMTLVGLFMVLQMASSNTILQTIVENSKRGRVMSFYTMAFMGMAPFGSLMAGSVGKFVGAPHTLTISGVVCIIAALIFALTSGSAKSLPIDESM